MADHESYFTIGCPRTMRKRIEGIAEANGISMSEAARVVIDLV